MQKLAYRSGKWKLGPKTTHIGGNNSLVFRHHQNWRGRALARLQSGSVIASDELCVTIPCSISEDTFVKIRKELLFSIEKVTAEIDSSAETMIAYINLDLFRL